MSGQNERTTEMKRWDRLVDGPFKFSAQAGNLLMNSGGQDFYFHTDDLGNPLALTDVGGNVVERYEYDDFGAPQLLSGEGFPIGTSASGVGNPHLFHGMEWDEETGLYYSRSALGPYAGGQNYDAEMGRCIVRNGGGGYVLKKYIGRDRKTLVYRMPI